MSSETGVHDIVSVCRETKGESSAGEGVSIPIYFTPFLSPLSHVQYEKWPVFLFLLTSE